MKLLVAASVLAVSTAASAAIQIHTIPFGPSAVPFAGSADLPLFDDHNGNYVLKSILFQYDVSMRAHVVALSQANDQIITIGVSGNTSADDGLLFNFGGGIFQTADSPVLNSGDIYDFGVVKGLYSDNTVINNPVLMALYTGVGTFTVDYAGAGLFGVVGSGNALLEITEFEADGSLTVMYEYNIIPAPGALALVGLAGLLGRRRRA